MSRPHPSGMGHDLTTTASVPIVGPIEQAFQVARADLGVRIGDRQLRETGYFASGGITSPHEVGAEEAGVGAGALTKLLGTLVWSGLSTGKQPEWANHRLCFVIGAVTGAGKVLLRQVAFRDLRGKIANLVLKGATIAVDAVRTGFERPQLQPAAHRFK